MPSGIRRAENGTTDVIVTILGRLGLWEVPHLANIYLQDAEPPIDQVCQVWLQLLQLLDFELSGRHLARYPSKLFICSCRSL